MYRREPKPEPVDEEEKEDPDEALTGTETQALLSEAASLEGSRKESSFKESRGKNENYGSVN